MKNRVKELRKARGLRQEDVAALLGVSRQTVNAVENDKYDPTLALGMKLASRADTAPRTDSVRGAFPRRNHLREICNGF